MPSRSSPGRSSTPLGIIIRILRWTPTFRWSSFSFPFPWYARSTTICYGDGVLIFFIFSFLLIITFITVLIIRGASPPPPGGDPLPPPEGNPNCLCHPLEGSFLGPWGLPTCFLAGSFSSFLRASPGVLVSSLGWGISLKGPLSDGTGTSDGKRYSLARAADNSSACCLINWCNTGHAVYPWVLFPQNEHIDPVTKFVRGGSKVSEGVAVSLSLCLVSIPDTIFTLPFPFSYSFYSFPFLFEQFLSAPPSQDTGHKCGLNPHKMNISLFHP